MDISALVPPLANTQEAYEKIFRWFSQPNAEFGYSASTSQCFYRDDKDRFSSKRCAIGCLIPDDLYTPELEGYLANGVATKLYDLFKNVNSSFLTEAQRTHDMEATHGTISSFLLKLNKVAQDYDLTLIAV